MHRHFLYLAFASFWALSGVLTRAESLPNALILRSINRSVFEIIIPKPENDPLTYEKPLPFDLLPFKIRNDKYYSVGSAFAINDSLLVTAEHVLRMHYRTQLGPHQLRDVAGHTYTIKNIVALSSYRDLVMFTIDRNGPLPRMRINKKYVINQPVLAVGNALGEGIVIRDGLLTSTYPEPEDGAFQLLRFSAAASPGNSGGPLLNSAGEIIGMVVMKSENENLNYALPITEVLSMIGKPAELRNKVGYSLPNCIYQKNGVFRGSFPLPLPPQDCRHIAADLFIANSYALLDSILIENHNKYFPFGTNSQNLLHDVHATNFPNIVAQRKDGTWSPFGPNDIQKSDLSDNGVLKVASKMFGYEFFQLDAPDSIPVIRFIDDDKLLMDNLLKGVTFNRTIGNSITRIISLGTAAERSQLTDTYGRTWLVRTWLIPYSDEKVMVFALPVPMGLIGYLRAYNLGSFDSGLVPDMRYLTDYIYFSYYGTLQRWNQFMRMTPLLPDRFKSIAFSYSSGKELSLSTPRMSIRFSSSVFAISERSDMQIRFAYFPEGDKVVWDVAGVQIGESKDNTNVSTVLRYNKPPSDVSEDIKTTWQKIAYQQYPYDQIVGQSGNRTQINGLHPAYKKYGPAEKLGRPVLYTTSFPSRANKTMAT